MSHLGRNSADPTDTGEALPTDLESALKELKQAKEANVTLIQNWMAQCERAQTLFAEVEKRKQELDNTYKELEILRNALISEQEEGRRKGEALRNAASLMKAGIGSRGVNNFKKAMTQILDDR